MNWPKTSPSSAVRLVAVVLVIGLAGASATFPRSDLKIRIVRNGEIPVSHLGVRFQRFDEPRLEELARRESLQARIDPSASQFEQILSLKDWVAAQWPHSNPSPYPPWDAIVILDWIRSGKTGGFCGQYSQVFLQSLAALGYTARYVEIGSEENPYAHYVTEVWSNDFNKWVMMDVDYNLHFEREDVPLSVLEIHDALLESGLSDVTVVLGGVREGHPTPASWPLETAELYHYVRFHLKADHLSKMLEPSFDRFNDMVEWEDERVVPWEQSAVDSDFPKDRLTRLGTMDLAVVESKLNQVRVDARVQGSGTVLLKFQHNVFQFEQYQFRKGDRTGANGPWQTHRSATLRWDVQPKERWIEIRGVNIRGIGGPSTLIEIDSAAADS